MASQAPGIGQKLRGLWNHPAGPKVGGKWYVGAAGCRGRGLVLGRGPPPLPPPAPAAGACVSASLPTHLCPA